MADKRNIIFPGQPPGNIGMMQGVPSQYVQPGMQRFPMMQQNNMMVPPGHMMQQQQQQQMFQMQQQMRMRPPVGMAPPPYTQRLADSYRARYQTPHSNTAIPDSKKKVDENDKKGKLFHEQQQRLKLMGKSGAADASKMIESMFGSTEKPKTKPQAAVVSDDSSGDPFGDFMGGPSVSNTPVTQAVNQTSQQPQVNSNSPTTLGVTQNVSPSIQDQNTVQQKTNECMTTPKSEPVQKPQEKKDLVSMMFECSDLSAPNKAKTFQKPSLKEIHSKHPVQAAPVTTVHESQQARHWNEATQDLSGLFILDDQQVQQMHLMEQARMAAVSQRRRRKSSGSGRHDSLKYELPRWCTDDEKVPDVYKQVLEASSVDGKISTERLYPILLLSGLPKESLGQIWSLCNKATPGQLTKPELYLMLALIAFAQNNYTSLSIEVLHKCPQPPVPFLGQAAQSPGGQVQTGTTPGHAVPEQGPGQSVPPVGLEHSQGPHGEPVQTPNQPEQGLCVPSNGQLSTAPQQHNIGMNPKPPHNEQISYPISNTGQPIMSAFTPSAFPISQNPPQTQMTATFPVTQNPPLAQAQQNHNNMNDDFADFQEASTVGDNQDDFGDFHVTPPVKSTKIEYVYQVPKPSDEKMEEYLAQDYDHSNVRNFFGSDDSSASPQRRLITDKGASTPNSLDDDFDDFKSADSKPSDSSQFTSSNSENEDFRMFESYLDDFSKKRNDLDKDDSPLHRPISKSSNISVLPTSTSGAPPSAIPAIKNLWPKGEMSLNNSNKQTTNINSQKGNPSAEMSDNEFADFQQAPNASSTVVSSNKVDSNVLIGDEDRYAALRSLESIADVTPSITDSNKIVEEEDDSWADFQTVDEETGKDGNMVESLDSNQLTVDKRSDFAEFNASSENKNSDWAAFSNYSDNTESKSDVVSGSTGFSEVPPSQQSSIFMEENEDDWSNFQGSSKKSDLTLNQNVPGTKESGLVFVKKDNLQKNEILNLFQVKSEPLFPVVAENEDEDIKTDKNLSDQTGTVSTSDSNLNIPCSSSEVKLSSNRSSISSQDMNKKMSESDGDLDDPFRIPPPMDYAHEEEEDFGAFSRGYDIEDIVHHKPEEEKKNKMYNFYGMGMSVSSKTDGNKDQNGDSPKFSGNPTEKCSVDNVREDKFQAFSEININKEPENISWSLKVDKSEDTQSVSSLELSFSKGRLRDVQDGDTQSVSSNEFGSCESNKNMSINPESKSVDSLDLHQSNASDENSGDQIDEESSKPPVDNEIQNPERLGIDSSFSSMPSFTPQNALPVLGDRYSGLIQDIPGSDKHAYEWQRCLENCYKMIKDANNVFNSISSSAVCNEVIKSESGSQYVEGIVEIYRVSCRITLAMVSLNLSTEKLKQILRDVDLSWNNLTAFLVGGNLMPDDNSLDFSNALLKSDDATTQMKACGVCLLNVDTRSKNFNQDDDCAKLTYGGRQYHSTCANFWLNCVDPMLPALKLPELL